MHHNNVTLIHRVAKANKEVILNSNVFEKCLIQWCKCVMKVLPVFKAWVQRFLHLFI